MSRPKEMTCHFCGTAIKPEEQCYFDMETAEPTHTDCLLRHAEAIGDHQTAKEIIEENKKIVGRD